MDSPITPEKFVDSILESLCRLDVSGDTRNTLIDHAYEEGNLKFGSEVEIENSEERILQIVALAVSAREYQFE